MTENKINDKCELHNYRITLADGSSLLIEDAYSVEMKSVIVISSSYFGGEEIIFQFPHKTIVKRLTVVVE